jgi:hypothetical protein
MKNFLIILIAILFMSMISFGQQVLTEQMVITKTHIDFSKEYISFILSGSIEIDGHTFQNESQSNPILYTANLDNVEIVDSNRTAVYTHRKCSMAGCNIIHLDRKQSVESGGSKMFWYNSDIDTIKLDPMRGVWR